MNTLFLDRGLSRYWQSQCHTKTGAVARECTLHTYLSGDHPTT